MFCPVILSFPIQVPVRKNIQLLMSDPLKAVVDYIQNNVGQIVNSIQEMENVYILIYKFDPDRIDIDRIELKRGYNDNYHTIYATILVEAHIVVLGQKLYGLKEVKSDMDFVEHTFMYSHKNIYDLYMYCKEPSNTNVYVIESIDLHANKNKLSYSAIIKPINKTIEDTTSTIEPDILNYLISKNFIPPMPKKITGTLKYVIDNIK